MPLRPYLISHKATLLDAMWAIDSNSQEFVLAIDDEGRASGTITDGDIRRALLRTGRFDLPVIEFLKRDFVFVTPEKSRGNVLDIMRACDIRQIPVLNDEGRPEGFHFLRELIGNCEKAHHAVIMAGGKGTRLRPLTAHCPKPLLHVAGKPILEHLVLHLVGQGIRRIWISVNYLGYMIEEHFGDGAAFGCHIDYLREDQELGTAGALSLLPETPVDPLLVLNGDLITQVDVTALFDFHGRKRQAATMCARGYQYEVPFGVIDANDCLLTAIREKPSCFFLVNAGIYVVEPELLSLVPANQSFTMPELMEAAMAARLGVAVYDMPDDWLDVGRRSDFDRARGKP